MSRQQAQAGTCLLGCMDCLEQHTWHKAVDTLVYILAHCFILSIIWFLGPTYKVQCMTNFKCSLQNTALHSGMFMQTVDRDQPDSVPEEVFLALIFQEEHASSMQP